GAGIGACRAVLHRRQGFLLNRSPDIRGGAIRPARSASRAHARRSQQFHTWLWTVVAAVLTRNNEPPRILRLQKICRKSADAGLFIIRNANSGGPQIASAKCNRKDA